MAGAGARFTRGESMKTRIALLISIALLAVLLFMSSTAQVQTRRDAWEYKVLENTWDERQMSALGAAGWELVAVDGSQGDHVRSFFKRHR
jgi:hypothetical protein